MNQTTFNMQSSGYGGGNTGGFITWLIVILVLLFLLIIVLRRGQRTNILSHWYHPFDDFNISTIDFYSAIEAKLKERKLPNVYYQRVEYHEGSAFTPKRLYLHIYRYEYNFDICAAPFGTEYFISWWLTLPNDGCLPSKKKKQKTFYQMDTEIMFRESISSIVQEAIRDFSQAKGFRMLTTEEKQLKKIPE